MRSGVPDRRPAMRLPGEFLEKLDRWTRRATSAPYEATAMWLRETLGYGEEEILRSLEAIAGLTPSRWPDWPEMEPCVRPEGCRSGVRSCPAGYGLYTADRIVFPILAATAASCAEHKVLESVLGKAERMRLRGSEAGKSPWTVAVERLRKATDILRNRAAYAL